MRKNKHNKGFTLAEVLIVVALIGVLSGVAFISVASYLRSMIQLERDGIAKEIFVAAQNHLTMVEHEGYLNQSSYGHLEGTTVNQDSIYYFVVNNGIDSSASEVLKLMLPFGSVDETVRLGGSYIIRYQKNPGLILDVFYCTENGRFPHAFKDEEYNTVKNLGDEGKKAERRNCSALGNSVVGWYGGAGARTLGKVDKLEAPVIEVINEDELYVKITNPNNAGKIKLIIQGERSHAQGAVFLEMQDDRWIKTDPEDSSTVIVILDDITTEYNKFSNLGGRLGGNKQGVFIPGESITIQAVAYNNDAITNIAYSALKTTNSLYRDVIKVDGENTAYITSLRHLENLDASISALSESLKITAASQKTDLSWKSFLENIKILNQTGTANPAVIYTSGNNSYSTEQGTYKPVNLTPGMTYDGESHTVSDVVINITANQKEISHAGLIEALENGTISNLMLKDFSVSTIKGDAGALAGALTGEETTIENVVARNTPKTDSEGEEESTSGDPVPSGDLTSASEGNAGGLIGSMGGGSITGCAAAVYVSGGTTAGGLIGTATSGTVTACYSGGHTDGPGTGTATYYKDGKPVYDEKTGQLTEGIFNVISASGSAGGLIGDAGRVSISYSYSTCSAKGTTVGGLIGTGSGSVTSCYATGLVKGSSENATGAFAGAFSGAISTDENKESYYYQIINEIRSADGTISYLHAIGNKKDSTDVKALDETADSYNKFVGADWKETVPYDTDLVTFYQGKYTLQTVVQLGAELPEAEQGQEQGQEQEQEQNDWFITTHYGDWPAPEIFVINQ